MFCSTLCPVCTLDGGNDTTGSVAEPMLLGPAQEHACGRRRRDARRPRRVDPPVRTLPSPSRRGRRKRSVDAVPRRSRGAHLADHRPRRLPGDAVLLGGGARRAARRAGRAYGATIRMGVLTLIPDRRAARARRRPRCRGHGPASRPRRASP